MCRAAALVRQIAAPLPTGKPTKPSAALGANQLVDIHVSRTPVCELRKGAVREQHALSASLLIDSNIKILPNQRGPTRKLVGPQRTKATCR